MSSLFIVGSGFTHSATNACAPLNSAVMNALRAVPASPWKWLARKYSTTDIEVALKRLDLDILASRRPARLRALRGRAEGSLVSYCSSFRYGDHIRVGSPWLLRLMKGAFAKGDVAVSLNYDCLLEGALDICRLWSPNEGYGKSSGILLQHDLLRPIRQHQFAEVAHVGFGPRAAPGVVVAVACSSNHRVRPT
jgi:hypothetical protein